MPTKALESLLYRDLSKVAASELIQIASPLLQELVNFSTNAFARCQDSSKGGEDEDIALLILYLHIIEMTDGIEILLTSGSGTPGIPIVRSSFEALLSINYILETEIKYNQRALSWTLGFIHNEIDKNIKYNSTTKSGQELIKALSDELGIIWKAETDVKSQERIDSLNQILKRPQYIDIEIEYQRQLRIQRKRFIEWYSLYDGPRSLKSLAHYLGKASQYQILYSYWSEISHAENLRFLTKAPDGRPMYRSLRDPDSLDDLIHVASASAKFILEATRLMLRKFHPGEEEYLARWYKTEIQEAFHNLRIRMPSF